MCVLHLLRNHFVTQFLNRKTSCILVCAAFSRIMSILRAMRMLHLRIMSRINFPLLNFKFYLNWYEDFQIQIYVPKKYNESSRLNKSKVRLPPGPQLRVPTFPMAGHLASYFAFSPPLGDGSTEVEPGWVDPRTWLSFQGPPGGPGIGPDSEVLGIAPYPPAYEFCGGMAYCGPQVGLGLVPPSWHGDFVA